MAGDRCSLCGRVRLVSSPCRLAGPLFLLLALLPGLVAFPTGYRLEPYLTQQVKPGRQRGGGGGGQLRLRPQPSDELPVSPPEFAPSFHRYSHPTSTDLDPHTLRRHLGLDYNSAFMAITQPLESRLRPNGTLVYDFNARELARGLPDDVKTMKLGHLSKNRQKRLRPSSDRPQFRRWLAAYTYCPVLYTWKDLGERFWPRWIREGQCGADGRSCSIPPGMTCRTQESTAITILWWYCKSRKNCYWIHIRYPIVTKCACAC